MTVNFKDLKALTNQQLDVTVTESLAAKTSQYQDVIPEEVLDLLEEAVETYIIVAPTLPRRLRTSARKEIEFFMQLYQDKIRSSFHVPDYQEQSRIDAPVSTPWLWAKGR
jgi:predicted transcriptional regulator